MSARDTYTMGDPEPDDSDDYLMSARWLADALAFVYGLEPSELDEPAQLWDESDAYRDGPEP
jgi:hypothetical protein